MTNGKTMRLLCLFAFVLLLLSSCAAQTGIPGHGGGKRFAIEQELVAAASRNAIKQIDLGKIRGKRVNLYVNSMGDSGAGNLVGGRFSLISQLHGDYLQTPQVKETYVYPRYDSNSTVNSTTNATNNQSSSSSQYGIRSSSTTSETSHSNTTQISTSSTVLPSPASKISKQEGGGLTAQIGIKDYAGLGAYHNSEEFASEDLQYLTALLQSYLFLQGVYVVPPSEAEVDVYITVDVFGTVYTRVDWFLANNEILRAKTAMEVFAVNTESGLVVMPPQAAVAEAEYNEQYILWAGPVKIRKSVRKAEPLLSDFTDVDLKKRGTLNKEKEESIPMPFQKNPQNKEE